MIEGKVAAVLTERELAINRGSEDGVEVGMRFQVFEPISHEIRDPDTNEVIGRLHRPKVKVKVTSVEDHMAVAKTYTFRTVNVGGTGSALMGFSDVARAFVPPKYERRYTTLKADELTWTPPLAETESYVKKGDPVRQLTEDDED